MAVIRNFDDPAIEQMISDFKATKCFMCGKILTFPFIMWFTSGGLIVFHPECSVDFLLAFSRDVYELKPRVDRNSCEHAPLTFKRIDMESEG